jgi:ankyrin repeat protein
MTKTNFAMRMILTIIFVQILFSVSYAQRERYWELHRAVYNDNLANVKLHLERYDDVNVTFSDGSTPLYCAIENYRIEVAKYLIEKGADINAKNDSKRGMTLLFLVAERGDLEVFKYLVEKGADVNARGKYGHTPIFFAAFFGRLEVLQYLVDGGADVNAKDNNNVC